MRKIAAWMLSICLLLSSVGCSSQKKTVRIGVAQLVSHPSLNLIRDNFTKEMKKLGYKDGKNAEFYYADASGQMANLNSIINQFEDKQCDVIVAIATPTAQMAARVSKDIPVIFSAVSDPVGAQLVSNLKHPGGNITGTSDQVAMDQILELAQAMNPDMKTVGFLYNASETNSVSNLQKAKKYCAEHGLTLIEGTGKDITELETAASVVAQKADILLSPNDNTVASAMASLSKTAIDAGIPYYVGADSMVKDGGLATVGIDYAQLGKETADMTDKVLNGTKAGSIPVKVYKKDLYIYVNRSVLKQLGMTLPDSVADNPKLQWIE
ncbi:ABC transporter substrate-binding protein [Catenisphaera adipataccumulans]|uniref:Putative ABC transport system substrate-binding protein n=1 Tax=Catenisphaera adipataccumulans TaxID=700500 RepID=A0A7W8FVU9_9FIRM|nr:ABC transporter substrate-binding protein [Catenisphaera adipataccumulans]MBB5182005.1 putative ABC transport system substrate-binding protein [Catenisphaera adipataccumulans]